MKRGKFIYQTVAYLLSVSGIQTYVVNNIVNVVDSDRNGGTLFVVE